MAVELPPLIVSPTLIPMPCPHPDQVHRPAAAGDRRLRPTPVLAARRSRAPATCRRPRPRLLLLRLLRRLLLLRLASVDSEPVLRPAASAACCRGGGGGGQAARRQHGRREAQLPAPRGHEHRRAAQARVECGDVGGLLRRFLERYSRGPLRVDDPMPGGGGSDIGAKAFRFPEVRIVLTLTLTLNSNPNPNPNPYSLALTLHKGACRAT